MWYRSIQKKKNVWKTTQSQPKPGFNFWHKESALPTVWHKMPARVWGDFDLGDNTNTNTNTNKVGGQSKVNTTDTKPPTPTPTLINTNQQQHQHFMEIQQFHDHSKHKTQNKQHRGCWIAQSKVNQQSQHNRHQATNTNTTNQQQHQHFKEIKHFHYHSNHKTQNKQHSRWCWIAQSKYNQLSQHMTSWDKGTCPSLLSHNRVSEAADGQLITHCPVSQPTGRALNH